MTRVTIYLPVLKRSALICFIIFACLPLIQMTIVSFTATVPTLTAEVGTLTFDNYLGIWSDPNLRSAFLNSIA